jgi:hypothetical protein
LSVAVDPNGDIALTGNYEGAANFGGGAVSAGDAGGSASFLVGFDSTGSYKWGHDFTSDQGVDAFGVAVDTSGNIAIGGQLSGTTDFGGGAVASTGDTDIFLAKYDSSGTYLWSEHFGVAGDFAFFRQAAFDGAGNVYIIGEPQGNALDLGCGPLPSSMGMFVAAFDPAGSCAWSQAFGSFTQKEALAVDAMGNVLVTGGFYGSIDFGSGTMTAPGGDGDVFAAKFTSAGSLVWQASFDSGAAAEGTSVVADSCGDILLAGDFSGTINFGSGAMTAANDSIFVAKLDASGAAVWAKAFVPTGSSVSVEALTVDVAGGPAITGAFTDSIDFGGGGLSATGVPYGSIYVAKFDSAGAYRWAYAGGPPASTDQSSSGYGLAAGRMAVIATGTFSGGTLSVVGDNLTAENGGGNGYAVSFAP